MEIKELKTVSQVDDFISKNSKLYNSNNLETVPLSHLRKRRNIIDRTIAILHKKSQSLTGEYVIKKGVNKGFVSDLENLRGLIDDYAQFKGLNNDMESLLVRIQSEKRVPDITIDEVEDFKILLEEFSENSIVVNNSAKIKKEVSNQLKILDDIISKNDLDKWRSISPHKFSLVHTEELIESDGLTLTRIGQGNASHVKSGVSESYFAGRGGKINSVYKPAGKFDDEFLEIVDDGLNVMGIKPGTEHFNEVAAYAVDRKLNLGVVPPTFKANYNQLGVGSAQEFVNLAPSLMTKITRKYDLATPLFVRSRPMMVDENVAILDIIIGNMDRHLDNLLITDNGASIAIDNGFCFPLSVGCNFSEYRWDWMSELSEPFSDDAIKIIKEIDIDDLAQDLSRNYGIENKAITQMKVRVMELQRIINDRPDDEIVDIAEEILSLYQ